MPRAWKVGALTLLIAAPAASGTLIVGTAVVTDGDTLEIRDTRVRLHAVDAPESSQSCLDQNSAIYPCGGRAANVLAALIGRHEVSCEVRTPDRYGRSVSVCTAGGVDLGAAMVSQGWALAYRDYGLDYVAEEDAARTARRGLWAGAFVEPWAFRKKSEARVTAETQRDVRQPPPAGCCRVCKEGKPCGDGCIPKENICRTEGGCACGG